MVGRGILGGQKFMISGIMFKFALDSSKLFGGNDVRVALFWRQSFGSICDRPWLQKLPEAIWLD